MTEQFKVALPVDHSASSRSAYEISKLFLRKQKGISITPIHIWGDWEPYTHNILFPFAPLGNDIVEFEREIELEARKEIHRWLQLDGKEKYIDKIEIYRGERTRDLVKAFNKSSYNLIALGAYGRSGVIPRMIGPLTYNVIQRSSIPVLVAQPLHGPHEPTIKRMTIAIDLTHQSEMIIRNAVRTANWLECHINLIYILPNPLKREKNKLLSKIIEFNEEEALAQVKEDIRNYLLSILRNLMKDFPNQKTYERLLEDCIVLCGDPSEELVNHCVKNRTDLLYMGKYDPSRKENDCTLGRVAREVLFEAPCHVYFDCAFNDQS